MKHLYRFAFLSLFFVSCLQEDGADPATPATFLRYYNGGNNDTAADLLKTADGGYLILATTDISPKDAPAYSKVKLIKTDAYGNVEWQNLYPGFTEAGHETVRWRASSVSLKSDGGYIVAGDDIQSGVARFLVLSVNADGTLSRPAQTLALENDANGVSGMAIVEQNGSYFVLGKINTGTNNMVLASINTSDFSTAWSKAYGSGESSLINRLFVDNANRMVWAGTLQQEAAQPDMRLVRAFPNAQNTDFDLNIGEPTISETANGICRYGNGFALIGSTNQKGTGTGDTDILFKKVSEDGLVLSTHSFPVTVEGVDQQQNEVGNAIASTRDGGLVLLGTMPSTAEIGRGEEDLMLLKVNAFGDLEWQQIHGSDQQDEGASVVQADDGGYVVLATTLLANLQTLTLLKTNGEGKVN
ncbi:MAG: hypothetical protein ACOYXA_03050 [Bacteroidota bacterium]